MCLIQREMISTVPSAEFLTQRPRVLDIDDSVFLIQRFSAIDRIARHCEMVICGNAWLAEHFESHPWVVVVPTAVDVNRYTPRRSIERSGTTIGWMGTHPNLAELDWVAPAIRRVLDTSRGVRMLVVSDRPQGWQLAGHPKVESRVWSAGSEVDDLHDIDIGVMPLAANAWTKGKCGYKLLTYLACGIPSLASPVGVNVDILGGDRTLLPETLDEWTEALLTLINDAGSRERLGESGLALVRAKYSVEAVAPRLANVLHDASRS